MISPPAITRFDIPAGKLTSYLLDIDHPKGGPKARFFLGYGFLLDQPAALAEALNEHAIAPTSTVALHKSPYGSRLRIEGPISVPNGARPVIRAIWQIERGSTTAVFVTAYPLK